MFGFPFDNTPYSGGYSRQRPYNSMYDPYGYDYLQAQAQAQQRRAQQVAFERQRAAELARERELARRALPRKYLPPNVEDNDEDYGFSYPYFLGDPRARLRHRELRRKPEAKTPGSRSDSEQEITPPTDSESTSSPEPQALGSKTAEELPVDQEAAAVKIQTAFRIYRSLSTIDAIECKFENLQQSFTFPELVDFQHSSSPDMITVNTFSAEATLTPSSSFNSPAKLAYSKHNRPILEYIESLNRLLTTLDGVESWGEKQVRERRKCVVRRIERELEYVEGVDDSDAEEKPDMLLQGWHGLWRRFNNHIEEAEVTSMDVINSSEAEPAIDQPIPLEDEVFSTPPQTPRPIELLPDFCSTKTEDPVL